MPHLLTLIDRNPYSPTYGCLDREYWHYRTLDFPCGMSQEGVLSLALLFARPFPGNRWQDLQRMRDLAVAGIRFAMKASHKDGTCDDYFPYERAMGALTFSTYAFSEAVKILELQSDDIVQFMKKRCDHLLAHNESGKLSNHQALSALTLYSVYQLTNDERYRRGAEDRLARTLSWQHPEEGWFQEYEGADPGYQTCTIDFLGKYYQKSGDASVLEPLKRAADFCRHFMHPDGSYGGEYGSRNTYHYYPHGFEILAPHHAPAARLNDQWLQGAARGKRYHNDDDRMIFHLLHNWLCAWEDYCPDRPEPPALKQADATTWLDDAGLLAVRRQNYYAVAGMKKGGVIKVFDRQGCIYSDTGSMGIDEQGSVFVSHLQDAEHQVDARTDELTFSVRGVYSKRKTKLASPLKLIVFRMLNLTLGRFFPNLLRSLLQKVLITGKNRTTWTFERTLRFDDSGVTIEDRIDPQAPFATVAAGSDATSIYVAASNVYQESVITCNWQQAPQNVLQEDRPWTRRIEPESTA